MVDRHAHLYANAEAVLWVKNVHCGQPELTEKTQFYKVALLYKSVQCESYKNYLKKKKEVIIKDHP